MKIQRAILPGILALSALPGFGWGQKGHDVTAFIAESHLTPLAKATAEELLDGRSIVYYANWLDNASHTSPYAYTKTWHYKNIDAGVPYAQAPLNPSGDVVTAIESQTRVLLDPEASKEEKGLALKMVVHLVGDIHQPMHVGHASDRGGNSWTIKYFGRENNLHSIWDSSLPESAHKWTFTEWQQQIDRASESLTESILAPGHPDRWAEETFNTCTYIYDSTPEGTDISYDYVADVTPLIELQLLRGGLRLADLLNSVFDPAYEPHNTLVKR